MGNRRNGTGRSVSGSRGGLHHYEEVNTLAQNQFGAKPIGSSPIYAVVAGIRVALIF
ncbi:MAG: hypothetical protein RLZ09_1166 [Pseudomonadota bacterium]|jgi:hypothetical protein